ncbi:MAG: penicillin-binding protein 2 [Candidatus Woesebacteria bacterium]|jgi:cell division protein FtsI/penicillin-binding protein 2
MPKRKNILISRPRLLLFIIYTLLILVQLRLFYWQIIKGPSLETQAKKQSQKVVEIKGKRGEISTSDGFLLVVNKEYFELFFNKKKQELSNQEIINQIKDILLRNNHLYQKAQDKKEQKILEEELIETLTKKMNRDGSWISLDKKISKETKEKIEELNLSSLEFEAFYDRFYPEASMAAHITGFVAENDEGEKVGYFGIEGALDKELAGKTSTSLLNTDALGLKLGGQELFTNSMDGRNITLTIRRDLQFTTEQMLRAGIQKYEADAGEIIIMEPKTGKILSLATWPGYEQSYFSDYKTKQFKNPSLTHVYEPGSTFKTLTVAAGLDSQVITPETVCTRCSGPRKIDKYTIKTWNEEYHPNINITEALAKSDNIAMIFVAEKIGREKFLEYLKNFGIGQKIGLDLQEDTDSPFPQKLGPVELATVSFGQGISTTSLQLIRAIATIANQGKMMKPLIVEKAFDPIQNKEIISQAILERQVISQESAQKVTKMMVNAAEKGEAQWTASARHTVAGKTGTSQIATKGGYEEDKTIASFVGFAPADDPRFIMLVKLINPKTSPWAAETAAPLWYKVADKVFLLMNIPSDK